MVRVLQDVRRQEVQQQEQRLRQVWQRHFVRLLSIRDRHGRSPRNAFTSTPVSAASFGGSGIMALFCAAAGAAAGAASAGAAAGASAAAVAAVSMRAKTLVRQQWFHRLALRFQPIRRLVEKVLQTTLSVSISIRISSRATASPTFSSILRACLQIRFQTVYRYFTSIIILWLNGPFRRPVVCL